MSAMGRRKQIGDKERRTLYPLITYLSSTSHWASLQNTGGNVQSYSCNDGVDFMVSLLGHWCLDVDHNKHPEKEEAGPESRLPASCHASPTKHVLPTRPGADELEQLLKSG